MKATQGPNDTQVKGFSDVSVTMKPAMNPKINLQQVQSSKIGKVNDIAQKDISPFKPTPVLPTLQQTQNGQQRNAPTPFTNQSNILKQLQNKFNGLPVTNDVKSEAKPMNQF